LSPTYPAPLPPSVNSLFRDPEALSVFLAGSVDPAQPAQVAALQSLHTMGPSHPSFTNTLHSLLSSVHSLQEYDQAAASSSSGAAAAATSASNATATPSSSSSSSTSSASASIPSSSSADSSDGSSLFQRLSSIISNPAYGLEHVELMKVQAYVEKVAAWADANPQESAAILGEGGRAATKQLANAYAAQPQLAHTNSSNIHATKSVEHHRSANASPSPDDDSRPVLLPDADLAKLIDAKLNGLANWEQQQLYNLYQQHIHAQGQGQGEGEGGAHLQMDPQESFSQYLCTCSHSDKQQLSSAQSASSSSAASNPSSRPSSPLPSFNLSGGLGPMTLCPRCGFFQMQQPGTAEAQIQSHPPTNNRTSATTQQANKNATSEKQGTTSPNKKKQSGRGNATPQQSTSSAATHASPSASTTPLRPSTPQTTRPMPTSAASTPSHASSVKPRSTTAAHSPSTGTCVNHGTGSCSCCSTLSTLLPKLDDIAAVQHRLASLENSWKQAQRSMTEKLRAIDKLETQLKSQQTYVNKMMSEERSSRSKAEEVMRKAIDASKQDDRLNALHKQLEQVESQMQDCTSSSSRAASEHKQRLSKLTDRILSLEHHASSVSGTVKEEVKAILPQCDKRIEKAVQPVHKEINKDRQTWQTANQQMAQELQRITAKCAALEQKCATLEQWKQQQQQQQQQMIGAAVSAAVNRRMDEYMRSQQYERLTHPLAPDPVATSSSRSHLDHVFAPSSSPSSGVPTSSLSVPPVSHLPWSSSSRGVSVSGSEAGVDDETVASDADALYQFDSSDAVASSVLSAADDSLPDSSVSVSHASQPSSFFSMFTPTMSNSQHAVSVSGRPNHAAARPSSTADQSPFSNPTTSAAFNARPAQSRTLAMLQNQRPWT